MKPDLNLLRVFDVLMELRSVSRAADRLGLTQSAISHALARLRDQLGDPLFVRSHGGLRPTTRAAELAPTVRQALGLLSEAVARVAFDPGTTTRMFTIGASPYFSVSLLPILVRRARAEAPHAQFRIVPPGAELVGDLDDGTIDLALGGFGVVPPRFVTTALFVERVVWVARAGSDLSDLARRPRLAITRPRPFAMPSGGRMTLEERIEVVPETTSTDAPVPLTIYDTLTAIAFIQSSDLVTLIPRQLALRLTERQGIVTLDAEDADPIEVSMLWHSRATSDPAHGWLRRLMSEAATELT